MVRPRMTERDGDIVMAGLLAGLLVFGFALASCLCHVPHTSDRCCEVER